MITPRDQIKVLSRLFGQERWGTPDDPRLVAKMPALLCKTGTSGIPARSGTVAGSASDVIVQIIEPSGQLSNSTREITVYNPFGTAIAADTYITCKYVNLGYWIVDAEDCPATP